MLEEEQIQELLRKLPKEVLIIYLACLIKEHSLYNFIPIIKNIYYEIEEQKKMRININTNEQELLLTLKVLRTIIEGYVTDEELKKTDKAEKKVQLLYNFYRKLLLQMLKKSNNTDLKLRILKALNKGKQQEKATEGRKENE